MSPLLIITLSWLALMLLVLVVCRMAAAGDRAMRRASDEGHAGTAPLNDISIRTSMPQYVAYRLSDPLEVESRAPARQHLGNRAQQDLDIGP